MGVAQLVDREIEIEREVAVGPALLCNLDGERDIQGEI